MKLLKIFCILILVTSTTTFSQQLGVWKNYTDLRSVSDADITNQGIWAASKGGAFYFNFNDNTYQTLNLFNNGSSYLSLSKLTSVAIDNEGKVWMGNEDGFVDIYNPGTNTFKRIFDFNKTDNQNKRINSISIYGDTAFISTAFGLSLINSTTFDIEDSPTKFGSFSSKINVYSSFVDRLVYVSTESGVAKQKDGSTNLAAPDSWETFTTSNGLGSNSVSKIVKYKDTLIAATSLGLSKLNAGTWVSFLPSFATLNIIDVVSSGNSLFILVNNGIYSYKDGTLTLISPNNNYSKIFIDQNSNLYAATQAGLLNISNNKVIAPDGPISNNFINMDVDGKGNLWVATGKDGKGVGINKFDGIQWSNFSVANTNNDKLLNNDFWRVYAAPDNTVYAGNWGFGFARFRDNKITNFSASNTGLVGIPGHLNFVVIHGLNTDSKGNLWVLNHWADNKQILSMLTPDSTWHFYTNPLNSVSMKARELVIDQNDTKWFTIGDGNDEAATSNSLYYMNENQSLYSSDINGWGKVSLSSSALIVISLAVDRRGELWVGTSQGIYIISDPGDPKNSISQFIQPLGTHSINAIRVDALNQKWVGTEAGVFLLSPDGTQVLQSYDTKNSPLLDDIITSIAIDDNSGTVYMATNFGLSSLTTSSINPKPEFSSLNIYPNPAILKAGEQVSINIDGLIRDTDIKILTVSGRLVTTFTTPGGRRAEWDGRDDSGNLVSSGIYLIIAYDKDGNNVATAKVAVIRR